MADERKYDFMILVAGSVIFWYSAYIYLIPLIFLPTILIFQRSLTKLGKFIAALLIGGIFSVIPYYFNHVYDLFSASIHIASSSALGLGFNIITLLGSNIYPPDNFQLFMKFVFEIIFAVMIFLVPAIVRITRKVNIFVPLSLVLAFLFIFLNEQILIFLWMIPFITILFGIYYYKDHLALKMYLTQSLFVPMLVIYNIADRPPIGGSGIFYLSYLQFHNPTNLSSIPYALDYQRLLIFLMFISIFLLIVIIYDQTHKNLSYNGDFALNKINLTVAQLRFKINNYNMSRNLKKYYKYLRPLKSYKMKISRKSIVFLLCLVALLVLPTINIPTPAINSIGGYYPFGYFNTFDTPMIYENATYEFTDNYKAIYLYPNLFDRGLPMYTPLAFQRNVTGENMALNMNISVNLTQYVPYSSKLVNMNPVNMTIFNTIALPDNFTTISPSIIQNTNVKYANLSPYITSDRATPFYSFSGDSVIMYNLSLENLTESSVYFLFSTNGVAWAQDQIFYLKYGNLLIQLYSLPESDEFILAESYNSSSWIKLKEFYLTAHWNYVTIRFSGNSILVGVDNLWNQNIEYDLKNPSVPITLAIGKDFNFPLFNYEYAMSGFATPLFSSNLNVTTNSVQNLLIEDKNTMGNGSIYQYAKLNTGDITILYGSHELTLIADGHLTSYKVCSDIFSFGRLSVLTVPIYIKINELHISINRHSNFLYEMVTSLYITPTLALIYSFTKPKATVIPIGKRKKS